MLSVAVVFIIFNRPDVTHQVFQTIREARPPRLYIIADGPRNEKEAVLTMKTREVISKVDWPCDVIKCFSETNMGCRQRILTGLNEVFTVEERAIILEDDCLPHPHFFEYCEQLLDRYRNDFQVMHIGGSSFIPYEVDNSYYFSKYTFVWGWATWARSWEMLKQAIQYWDEGECKAIIKQKIESQKEQEFWQIVFKDSINGKLNAWSYLWTYTCWKANAFSTVPAKNLVSNMGFRSDGTHTKQINPLLAEKPIYPILPIKHPEKLEISRDYDEWVSLKIYAPETKSVPRKTAFFYLKKLIKRVLFAG